MSCRKRPPIGCATALAVIAFAVMSGCAHRPPVDTPASAPASARLTPADLQARMRTIQATIGTIQMKMAANKVTDAAKDAQQLATAFGDVERFWSQNTRQDAVMWSQQARTQAAELAGAAAAGDTTKASAIANRLTSTCMQCHATYREGSAATGFRIKPGVVQESATAR